MKKILILALSIVIFFIMVSSSHGSYWSIHCTNASCVASQGGLKVYWVALSPANWRTGELKGIEGISISIDTFKKSEQSIASVLKKNTSSDTTEKPYQLLLVKWIGDTAYEHLKGINKYLTAMEFVWHAYIQGKIEYLIKGFFIAQNAKDIDSFDIRTPLNDDNKLLLLTKYIGLTRFGPIPDPQERYSLAASAVAYFATGESIKGDTLEKVYQEFTKNIQNLQLLLEPGQTAIDLYKAGYKELAFAKWYADQKYLPPHINQMSLQDRYLTSISLVDSFNNKKLQYSDVFIMETARLVFEMSINKEDESVKVVTVERKFPVYFLIILFMALVLIVVIFVMKSRILKIFGKNKKIN